MKKLLGGYFVLLIYFLGIGFISGSIVHFTLNPWRFGLIGIVGGVLFAIATYIQDFWGKVDSDISRYHILYRVLIGVFLSIGLGMISGSIQHFDEITYEALWYIPIGTFLSTMAWRLQERKNYRGSFMKWLCISLLLIGSSIVASIGIQRSLFPDGPVSDHHGPTDGSDHNHGGDHHGEKVQVGKTRDEFTMDEKMNIHMCLMGGGEGCDNILAPENKMIYSDAIMEQCDLMPGMEACNAYFEIQTTVVEDPFSLEPSPDVQEAGRTEIVTLEDGDAYTITIEEVVKIVNGVPLRMFAYNGTIPGPILKAPQGATIQLTVVNMVDDIETTMHHHGLRLDNRFDGVPKDMGGYDIPIKKGETLEYTLTFPDSGLFWYHPHVREDLQQELGLYGNYLIEGTNANDLVLANSEEVIMLDDLFLDDTGAMMPYDTKKGNRVVMGRFGNVPLINGTIDYTFTVEAGAVTRIYFTNVANVTPFNLTIPGVSMKLVGGDIGKYEREEMIDTLVIAPAERYIVDVYTPASGTYEIINDIGEHTYTIASIQVTDQQVSVLYDESFTSLASNEGVISDIDQYRKYFDAPIEKTLRLDVEMDGMDAESMQGHGHHDSSDGLDDHAHGNDALGNSISLPGGQSLHPSTIEREDNMPVMNEASTTDNTRWYLVDEATGKRNMDIMWKFTQGDVVKIRIYNDPNSVHPMQHPIHFHGQRFLVLDKNGEKNENLVWKDTVLVPTGEYVDILLDASNPGTWMVHCHIAEHLTAGMMMKFMVEEK